MIALLLSCSGPSDTGNPVLASDFPGWTRPRHLFTNASIRPKRSARADGLEHIKARYLRPDQLMPQYRTMVYLTHALLGLRARENSGVLGRVGRKGLSRQEREELAQIGAVKEIRRRAPKTLSQVVNLPTVYDALQDRLIRTGSQGTNDVI